VNRIGGSGCRRPATKLAVLLATALPALWVPLADPSVVPAGFSDQFVAKVGSPTAMAFTPDGRILVTSKAGKLSVIKNGAVVTTPAIDLTARVCSDGERGLVGVAVDPAFGTANHFIYLYYTYKKFGSCPTLTSDVPVNRVSRFRLPAWNVIDPATEKVLIDNVPNYGGYHIAGDLEFGKDGNLYISSGDGGCDYAGDSACDSHNDAARDQNILLGKILRITPAVDPNAVHTRFFIDDVGQGTWEEIDNGHKGADYGWNVREGPCATGSRTNCGPPPPGMTNPIWSYDHNTGCTGITGGAFVPNGIWPAAYDNTYLYGDFICGKIIRLTPADGGFTASDFVTGLGTSSITTLKFGPYGSTQAAYYLNYLNGGELRRITYVG
jgi:hypothetical protein